MSPQPPTVAAVEQKFDQVYQNIKTVSQAIGINVYDPNYRFSFRTFMLCTILSLACFSGLYTLWIRRCDVLLSLEVVPFLMLTCQGIHKTVLRIFAPNRYRALHDKSRGILLLLNEHADNGTVMFRALHVTCILQKVLQVLYCSVIVMMPIVTSWIFIRTGERVFDMPLFFPGVDESTGEGFILLMVIHAAFWIFGIFGYLTVDCQYLAILIPISAYVDGIQNEVRLLNWLLESTPRREEDVSKQLVRIFRLHQELLEYEAMIEEHYVYPNLTKIASVIFGLISTIFMAIKGDFRKSFFPLAMLSAQLTQYCFMGTVITVKNDQLTGDLYDIKWNLMKNKQAKQLIIALQRAQNISGLTIGKLAPLNVQTYVRILNTIYSYATLLNTFLE